YSATNSPYYTMYTYDDRIDPTNLSEAICGMCWRNAEQMGFLGAASGYGGSSVGSMVSSWAPNFMGPVYLGLDASGNSIHGLPTQIARAGGAESFYNMTYNYRLGAQAWNATPNSTSFVAGYSGYFPVANGRIDFEGAKYYQWTQNLGLIASTNKFDGLLQQAQNGPPTIFVNMYATPKGFSVDEYLTGLKSALIANGFSNDLVVERSSISGSVKAWWNNSPTATVTIKNFRLGYDELDAGGYSHLNNPNSMIIYNGLSPSGEGKSKSMWKYINVTLHEIGHGIFGFNHDNNGMTTDPSSIMDYRSSYRQGAGFNGEQQVIIMESIWGKN
ncbi:MAG: hypothetical protein J0L67_02850, partial [Cytophagales bacterium]|nr:hypothetical protein [Cytophagales bacterium]